MYVKGVFMNENLKNEIINVIDSLNPDQIKFVYRFIVRTFNVQRENQCTDTKPNALAYQDFLPS